MRRHLDGVIAAGDEGYRRSLLADLAQRSESLRHGAALARFSPVSKLASALAGLLKKLAQQPQNTTPSSLNTLAHALALLQDLCAPGLDANLVSDPPPRLLVVDDDPMARRAITYALQVAFEKPDSAEDGPAALALAQRKAYAVVFADIQMPAMDGFTLCSKIHETALNAHTPVVFVTCHSDAKAREQAARCGGADFIAKPFLLSEITLKALTLTLQSRMQRKLEAA